MVSLFDANKHIYSTNGQSSAVFLLFNINRPNLPKWSLYAINSRARRPYRCIYVNELVAFRVRQSVLATSTIARLLTSLSLDIYIYKYSLFNLFIIGRAFQLILLLWRAAKGIATRK